MAEENEILRKSFVFSSIRYLSYFLMLFTGLLVTKFLGPAGFGVYSAMLLILKYSTYSFMGFYSACYKMISFLKGKKKYSQIQEIRDSTFTPSFYLTVFLSFIVFMSSFFLKFDQEVLNALRLVAILITLQQVYYFYTIYLRTDKEFVFFGAVDLSLSIMRLLCIIIFIKYLSVFLILTAVIIAYLVSLILGFTKKPYLFNFKLNAIKAKKMFIFGLPTTVLSALDSVFMSIDKLIVIRFFDRTIFGIYSFAALVVEFITIIPANITMVILPSQLERSGAKKSNLMIKNISFMPMMVVSYFLPVIIGGAFFFSKPVVTAFFEKYTNSLIPLSFLMFGAFFIANNYILESQVVSLNNEKKIMIPKILLMFLLFSLAFFAVKNNYGLYGIALSTTIVYFLYFLYLSFFSFSIFNKNWLEKIKDILIILFPFVYMLSILFLLNKLDFGVLTASVTVSSFIVAGIKYMLFLLFNFPLFYFLNKKTGIIKLGLEFITSQYKKRISKAKTN
jgi:O-antigen/teichoic acid export membrane protein